MLPDQVSNPGPMTYESGALPIALRGPANCLVKMVLMRGHNIRFLLRNKTNFLQIIPVTPSFLELFAAPFYSVGVRGLCYRIELAPTEGANFSL